MTSKKRYYELKNAGLCTKCGNKIGDSPSTVRCSPCYEKFVGKKKGGCVKCNKQPIIIDKYCQQCFDQIVALKDDLLDNTIKKYDHNQNCQICDNPINTLGQVCQECLSKHTFTKDDAIKKYGSQCILCHEEDLKQLRLASADISKAMKKYGIELYKIVCFSNNPPEDYRVLCHYCYREECILYIAEARDFFDMASSKEPSPDIISKNVDSK